VAGLARIRLLLLASRRPLLYEAIEKGTATCQVEREACSAGLPSQCPEALPGRAPIRADGFTGLVGANPSREVIEFVTSGEDSRQAHDASVGGVGSAKKTLDERLVTDFPLAWTDHVAFIKNYQPNIVDEGGIIAQREIEFLRRRDDDLPRAQRVFVTRRQTTGAVER
jgi:hypothetical protein